jgi:hypothetical protein
VHSPIGLDIGAITPEEISISILAELISVRRQVKREVPHMSWFQSQKGRLAVESDQAHTEGLDAFNGEPCPVDK